MAEETKGTETDAKEQGSAATSAETIKPDTESPELTIPKHRYDEVAKKLRDLEATAAAQAKAQAASDEKKLAEQAEWQKLADKRKADVEALTPKAELADKLTEMVTAQYAAEIKDWPEQVRNMAPDDGADILTKLVWMSKAKPLAVALMADKAPIPGNGGRPKVAAPAGAGAHEEKVRTDHASWTRRGI